jgi:hypothetical protein
LKKALIIIYLLLTASVYSQAVSSEISSMPGAFSRLGFGARGMGMGNALSSVTEGNLVSYYNPALPVFQQDNSFQTSYSFLSLDRSLNFINYTRRFDFFSSKDSSSQPKATAGVSIGIINSGVSNIDGRDNDGNPTGNLTTSENQFFIALANKFSSKLAAGIAFKVYYYNLYQQISATGVGFDIGALYSLNKHWNISFVLTDLNSQYRWDTSPVYDQQGTTSTDKFPTLKKIGVSYNNDEYGVIVSAELESSNGGTNILRSGIEYCIFKNLYLRGGIDQVNLSNSDFPSNPSLGFSYIKSFGNIKIGVDYAFVVEPYSPEDRQIVGLNFNF